MTTGPLAGALELNLLGEVTLRHDGRPLAGLPSRKAEALLIYLACTRRPAAREVLADLLWDDRPTDLALSNLRTILSSLRKAVGVALTVERDRIVFNRESDYQLDVEAFERELTASQAAGTTPEMALAHLRAAVEHYSGDFLAGFHLRESRGFEAWATLERERLNRLAVGALQRLAQHCLDTGDYAGGLDYADRRLRIDPLSEEAHRHLMLLLARTGQRTRALAAYEACRRVLADELDVAPTEATTALYAHIRSANTLGTHNLPPSGTEFIGRTAEVAALIAALARPDVRLLTLLGPGGIGKTRLAIETARTVLVQRPGMFLHGVRYAALAGLHQAQFLPAALAEALDLRESGDPKQQLIEHLRQREMLLVLDNVEHLLSADNFTPSLLADLLVGAPMVKFLLTSRERLNLQEERLFDVGGLAAPTTNEAEPNLHMYSAAQLFLASARRARRDFAPTPEETRSITGICHLLDGAPLGLELAGAATRHASCNRIAEALAASLDALSTTAHNVPERQRSLRAAFEYSWGLLAPAAREHFARLSIFPDSFDTAAVEAVAEVDAAELNDLADRSLVQWREGGRHLIHPMLRQYAAEKLAEQEDRATALAERHAQHYLDLVARQGSGEKPEQRLAIRQDLANVRAAWQWAGRQDLAALRPVIAPLHGFYTVQSWFEEGIAAFTFAADRYAALADAQPELAPAYCQLLMRLARMQIHLGRLDAARSTLEEVQAQLGQVNDADQHSTALVYLAITHYYAGDYDRATALADESLRASEQTGNREGIAFALNFRGSCAKAKGDYAEARAAFDAAYRAYEALEDGIGAAMALNNLGNLEQATGDYEAAQRHYQRCSELFKTHDHLHGAATTLANAGRLAVRQGHFDDARRMLSESLELKRSINDRRGMAVALVTLGDVATKTGAHAEAHAHLTQALTLAEQAGDLKLALDALVAVAALDLALGRREAAARCVAFALAHKATAQESREWAEQVAAELGGVPPEAEAAARRWAQEDTLPEVIARALGEAHAGNRVEIGW
jgi:DNA-binding SARP family transcriptional activator/predicted ATPase/uncharacterized protein HemY